MESEFPIAFVVEDPAIPHLEIRINFGVFAGREATSAEIDDLAKRLQYEVSEVEIVAENRYEFGEGSEAQVHQVRVAVHDPLADTAKLVDASELWARACIEQRHAEVSEI